MRWLWFAAVLSVTGVGCSASVGTTTSDVLEADADVPDAAVDAPEDAVDVQPDRFDAGPRCLPPRVMIAGRCVMNERFSTTTASRRPVDILWAVDTSGSMVAETAAVNANLNRFANIMASSGLDYRVVMVARRGTANLRVCVPPPLGGSACANGPRFLHVDQSVGSTDALIRILSTRAQWNSFLRPGSARFLVVVTDDESSMRAVDFDFQLRTDPAWEGYTFNSIVGYETTADCPTMVRRGTEYLFLTDRTGGQRQKVCASDWSGTFSSFARVIVSRVTSWVLFLSAQPDTIEVWITPPGSAEVRLTSGWSYDPATNRLSLDASVPAAVDTTVRVVYVPR